MPPLISLNDIVKNYRTMRALDEVSVDIHSGVTGLLGPNGAGKSTMIKLILGLVKYDSGSGTILGHELGKHGRAIRNKIGYMPEDDCYIPGMSGVEVVQFAACLAGLPTVEALRRSHEILDFCGMKQERYRTIETYSTGMRQKIKFAAAIVHDPEYLIFDEPTSGLDPEEREALLNRIRLLSEQAGKSVMLSTHILPDVQAICDDVLILSQGKMVKQAPLAVLNRTASPSLSFRVMGDAHLMIDHLKRTGFSPRVSSDNTIVVESDSPDLSLRIWEAAQATDATIVALVPAKNSLEEIFIRTVKEAADASA